MQCWSPCRKDADDRITGEDIERVQIYDPLQWPVAVEKMKALQAGSGSRAFGCGCCATGI